ncbi:MAG TPA: ParB N-terminal domain-containing protein, partial [Mycobacteriales bacterium]
MADSDSIAGAGDQTGPDSPGVAVPATLVHVDPTTLVLEANVRSEITLDRAFVGSIRDHGVLVPIVAWRAGGELRVRMGQRRTVAAIEAGRDLVPVYVVDAVEEGEAAEIARIVDQIVENVHRVGLRDIEQVRGHQQLNLLGLTAGQIARRTRTSAATVKTSLQVAGSELATAAMERFDLTLDQAAALAEFQDDTEAVETLTATARTTPEKFPHVVQRLRDEAAETAARNALTDHLAEAGVRVIENTDYIYTSTVSTLRELRPTPESEPGAELSVDAHADCPGHAAFLDNGPRWGSSENLIAVYVCTDWPTHGHALRNAPTGVVGTGDQVPGPGTGGMSAEQKAERRRVVTHNKAWDSATTVRRDWLRTFLSRKSPPKDAPQWIAATLAAASHEICKALEVAHPLACDLLGMDHDDRPYHYRVGHADHPVAVAAGKATAARATMLTLAMLLGGLEQSTDRFT